MDNDRDNNRDNEWEELVRRRAYAIWEQEGRPDGQHERHWEQAAREMQGEGIPPSNAGTANGDRKRDRETATDVSTPPASEANPAKAARSGAER